MRLKNNKSGFTLLEIIIVIIIVGVLASLALPRFFRTIEFTRSSEALNALGVLKRAADHCAMMAGAAAGGVAPIYTNCVTYDQLNIEDPGSAAGASFSYGPPTGASAVNAASFAGTIWTSRAFRDGAPDTITLTYNTTAAANAVTRSGTLRYAGIQ